MHIETLKLFCDLADTESFTKSAQLNGVTQSAVSQQVSALERHFKALLIERSKKKFRLTPEGEVVYEYGKRLVELSDQLQHRLHELKGVVSGAIRISTTYSLGLHGLPPVLRAFQRAFPAVRVQVEYQRFDRVYADVIAGTADLGLVGDPGRDPRLEVVPLRRDAMVVIAHPAHPFAKKTGLKVADLHRQKCVGFAADDPGRRAIDRTLKAHDAVVDYAMTFDDLETVKQAVEQDAGLAIVPVSAVQREVEHRTLVALKLKDEEFSRPLAAIHRKGRLLSPALKQFLGALQAGLGDAPPRPTRNTSGANSR